MSPCAPKVAPRWEIDMWILRCERTFGPTHPWHARWHAVIPSKKTSRHHFLAPGSGTPSRPSPNPKFTKFTCRASQQVMDSWIPMWDPAVGPNSHPTRMCQFGMSSESIGDPFPYERIIRIISKLFKTRCTLACFKLMTKIIFKADYTLQ